MNERAIFGKIALQFFTIVAASALAVGFAVRPYESWSFVLTLLVASYRPIWKDGRVFDRLVLCLIASVVGLFVWQFIGTFADYLFYSGASDASGASNIAGFKVIAFVAAYLITRLDISAVTDRIIGGTSRGSFSPSTAILALLGAHSIGVVVAFLADPVFVLSNDELYAAMVIGAVVTLIPAYMLFNWFLNTELFRLRATPPEGPRRLGLLSGWIVGVPVAVILFGEWTYWFRRDTGFFMPLAALVGFVVTYVIVHAFFWTKEGFRTK